MRRRPRSLVFVCAPPGSASAAEYSSALAGARSRCTLARARVPATVLRSSDAHRAHMTTLFNLFLLGGPQPHAARGGAPRARGQAFSPVFKTRSASAAARSSLSHSARASRARASSRSA